MTDIELRAAVKTVGLTQGVFAARLGVSRPTLNHWINGAIPIPQLAELAIRWLLAQTPWKPALRRKRNLLLPTALREKKCPGCGGDLWFTSSRGVTRRHLGRIYIARCKTHLQNSSACPRTSIVFDRLGQEKTELPRFAPRPFKKVNFDRPECPICHLAMKTGKAARRMVSRGGRVNEETVLRLYCDGGRWGQSKHPMKTIYVNPKGGPETVPRGKHRSLSELPAGLRREYPQCCGKPMARQAAYKAVRRGVTIWWFRCRACNKQQGFDESGKRHEPYVFGDRRIRKCPDCGRRLVKAGSPKNYPELQRYTCKKYDAQHRRSVLYFHRKNGREYILVGSGSTWKAQPVGDLSTGSW